MHNYKVIFDRTIPVDDIPNDIRFVSESRGTAFPWIMDNVDFDTFPLEDVLEDGRSVFDEFNDFVELSY